MKTDSKPMPKAPDFSLLDQDGVTKSLGDFKGNWLVLYFYPKDDTPGCTTEACNFRDARDVIAASGDVAVVGVSKDSVKSHKKFVDKHRLNFILLSDPDHKVIAAYNSWKPQKFAGREFTGTKRNTFIINPDGCIVKMYEGVDPQEHVLEILQDLGKLRRT